MSSDDTDLGKGATDEGWGDELTRTGHEDVTASDSETDLGGNTGSAAPDVDETPTPRTPEQTPETGTNTEDIAANRHIGENGRIKWELFLCDEEVAEHAIELRETLDRPDVFDEDGVHLRPPMRRFLNSKPNSLDGTEQLNLRIEPVSKQAYKELERAVADNFDDEIKGAYLADAVVRVACLHADEVYGMLGAYGFDFEFK